MSDSNVRRYEVHARSTDVFGRVLCGCRDQHFVVDGPIQNGFPGEAVTPVESFLAGVAACRPDLALLNSVRLDFRLAGVTRERAAPLVETFQGR